MKVVQILGGVVHWHTPYRSLEEAPPFAPDIILVEAPAHVFPGWGYIDGEFVQPTPPEGFLYDEATGTFYPENEDPPVPGPTVEELLAMIAERDAALAVFGIPEEVEP